MSAGRKTKKHFIPTSLNKVKLVKAGKEYFDCLINMIEQAEKTIHLQTYIFDDDETGQAVAAALKAAVSRKVQVFVMVDAYASRVLSQKFINELRSAGINFRLFGQLFKSSYFYFGRRLHQKLVVTDAFYALTGGINISNRYNDMPGEPAWLDFALYTEGEIAKDLCDLCWNTWNGFTTSELAVPCPQPVVRPIQPPEEACEVSMCRNDWVRRKNEISSLYVNMFRQAQSHITILSSYFLPGKVIRSQLAAASRRGVKIRVIIAGVSDVPIVKYAERHIYAWLLKHKVELYEYKPTVLHGKIAVCDTQWATVGSYNINNLSAYASIELNLKVKQTGFAKATETMLNRITEQDCKLITTEYQLQHRSIFKRFTSWLSYNIVCGGLYLSTFYYRHKY